ncbi:uncharacterized protein LOC126833675 isoform X3 [Adelges cooleyi]|uniref:uncharacterized protein LOC126833675 isoform X3 n=1 Tax=Adelges cooleyi TaxID=133065 RepID=UPI00217F2F1D|nr:uncharacterized protein LOC126833675 isoform X3 [Adelges cooleyi]
MNNEDSIENFHEDVKLEPEVTIIIAADTMVTCGRCKQQMPFADFDNEHRITHYNLCWLDGIESEIDYTDTSAVLSLLRGATKNKPKIKFICEWCNDVKLSIVGFCTHLQKCRNNTGTSNITNNKISYQPTVTCGRCYTSMTGVEYINNHRHIHNNLCWVEGEETLDYTDENKIAYLLRSILPKYAERNKKVSFTCEWCGEKKKSVSGFAKHVGKCDAQQNLSTLPVEENNMSSAEIDDELEAKYNSTVTCGRCDESMLYREYEEKHKNKHYNLCWLKGEKEVDFDDETTTQDLVRKSLPVNAAREKKIMLSCEWCDIVKRSIPGFVSHLKKCQLRPNTVSQREIKNSVCISSENNSSKVTCGRCNKEMTLKEYHKVHAAEHYNLCWIVGEEKPNFDSYEVVLSILKQFIPFKVVRGRGVKLTCEDCKTVKKSIPGFASHVLFCKKSEKDTILLLAECDKCGRKVKPTSMICHKLNCHGSIVKTSQDYNHYSSNTDKGDLLFYKSKRKQRPLNVLSLHPETKYLTEYCDYFCILCNSTIMSYNDIVDHVEDAHNIDINEIKNNLGKYVSNKYDPYINVSVKPLLHYYDFYKCILSDNNLFKNIQPDIQLLHDVEAKKYLPICQQSCKIFCSEENHICVNLFQSIYINEMYWLNTGGPDWAMAWCPASEDVQVQYLAISCHPNPDIIHKEMQSYKYPSLIQLWKFDTLHNINHSSSDMMPYMSYGIAHEFGAVWDMAWCPAGSYEPNKKIGLLALSTSSGDCPIFAMPHMKGDPVKFNIYKVKPIIARNFEFEWNNTSIQCTRVCWQATAPFKTLICGYTNGLVSIFNLNLNSIFLKGDILYPSNTFRASKCCITGLSMNYLNPTILATTTFDGKINLWDIKSTEDPIFDTKFYNCSDCTWLQQCYTLMLCSKSVNSLFSKVRSINFFNCNDDLNDYNPELFVLSSSLSNNKTKTSDIVNKIESFNDSVDECCDLDESINSEKFKCDNDKMKVDNSYANSDDDDDDDDDTNNRDGTVDKNNFDGDNDKNNGHDDDYEASATDSNTSDEELSNLGKKKKKLNNNHKNSEEDFKLKDCCEDDELYGPSFFQSGIHWSIAGSNWMNIIATGDENGNVYENCFSAERNHLRKKCTKILQLSVNKVSISEESRSEPLNLSRFNDTVKEFALDAKFYPSENDEKRHLKDSTSLLRYPLENITKVVSCRFSKWFYFCYTFQRII